MILRWLTFFSVLAAFPAGAATVTGTVRMLDSADPGVRKLKDYSGAVVWLEPLGAVAPALFPAPARKQQMVQKDKRFTPHVLAIRAGTPVEFPNYDPIFHNAFSNFAGQVFDVGLYPPGGSRTVSFKRPGVVHVFCNIHPTMSAIIVVLRTPWFATSGRTGAFTIPDVPPGEYRLHVYHERATRETLAALDRRIVVPAAGLALPQMAISETGFVELPHKNKYGQEYPPVADDRVYPAEK